MAVEVVAAFEKRLAGGLTVSARLGLAADRFDVAVLFGPSGAGKTTLLRCLAGLDRPDAGVIRYGDEVWFDAARGVAVPPQARRVGYVFQDYALFPHLTVAQNVGYGLAGQPAEARRARVRDVLRLVGLAGLERRHPRQLSGGEQQRVALARAVAHEPRLLLLDEPLSALDAPTREQVRRELRRWLRELAVPAILVTHDRVEALALGDTVAVVHRGRILQTGPVPEVFSRPADLDVAAIVGVETVLPARVAAWADGLVTLDIGRARLTAVAPASPPEDLYVGIRAEEVTLVRGLGEPTSARNRLPGRVERLTREGPLVRVALDCGFPLTALLTKQACDELDLREGDRAAALVKAQAVHLIPRG